MSLDATLAEEVHAAVKNQLVGARPFTAEVPIEVDVLD
jgi:hypothetical protein